MNCEFWSQPNPPNNLEPASFLLIDWRARPAMRKQPACQGNLQFIFHARHSAKGTSFQSDNNCPYENDMKNNMWRNSQEPDGHVE